MTYFSDTEGGPREPVVEAIPGNVWRAVVHYIGGLDGQGAFGEKFPDYCPDGQGVCGTDTSAFVAMLGAEGTSASWPLDENKAMDALVALDVIQFCYWNIAKPRTIGYHSFFGHNHLSFDREAGRDEFLQQVNRLFSRNAVAFELRGDGTVVRLLAPEAQQLIRPPSNSTGDVELDRLLGQARDKFRSPDPVKRGEALEHLWDAWERLKSIEDPSNKKNSVALLLSKASGEPNFASALDREAKELTDIGNKFRIRHAEVTQVPLSVDAHVDYLFLRMFSIIRMLLNTTGRG